MPSKHYPAVRPQNTSGSDPGANGVVISSGSSTFTTSSTTAVDVTNLSVTLTTTGRPVWLALIPNDTTASGAGGAKVGSGDSSGTEGSGQILFLRGASVICNHRFQHVAGGATSNFFYIPPSAYQFVDLPAAGTYTYKVQAYVIDSSDVLAVTNCKLVAMEL